MGRPRVDWIRRAERLEELRCPLHGTSLSQVGTNWFGAVVGCPRGDCAFRAETDSTWVRVQRRFRHLLLPEDRGWLTITGGDAE